VRPTLGLIFACLFFGCVAEVSTSPTDSVNASADASLSSDNGTTAPDDDTSNPALPGDGGTIPSPVDAGTAADTATPPTPPTGEGNVGDACASDGDCNGANAACLNLPNGYCTQASCGDVGCPDGSACYQFEGDATYCIKQCTSNADCRADEGYECDADNTCWPTGDQPAPTGASPIGGPCASDADCKDQGATCYPENGQSGPTGFINGYCIKWNCTADSCPAGSTCLEVTNDGTTACFAACAADADCPQQLGYVCSAQSSTCWPGCNGDAECPPGYGCHPDVGGCVKGWSNEPFECDDQSYEPNDSLDKSASIDIPTEKAGVDLCSGDIDWYKVTFPKGHIGTVGATFNHIQGDLDLMLYDASGKFLGNRLWQGGPENYPANYRGNESNYEFLSVLNQKEAITAYFKVQGFSGAKNSYTLEAKSAEWKDGPLCTAFYSEAECAGYTGAQAGNLQQFPFPQADDTYVPNGYMFDSYGSYRWLRRELIMLVRHGIHEVQQQFNGTTALGLIDMCDKEGITPGYDVGDPRHPESTHDQGGNIDIAYYQTDGNSSAESVCGPNNTDNDGYFCTSINNHIMDVPRSTFFMVALANHPRIRVIGVDKLLAPLIEQQAQTFVSQGVITQTEYNKLMSHMAYGDGWPFHHHHMHVSMKWWSQGIGNGFWVPKDPPVGCGYRMPGDGPLPMKKGDFHPHP
jgi:hypothetical protein